MSTDPEKAEPWVVIEQGTAGQHWWNVVRENHHYGEGLLGAPWGNFSSREWAEATAARANALEALVSSLREERDEARREAKVWKGHHDYQLTAKRRGHDAMKRHYEALIEQLMESFQAQITAKTEEAANWQELATEARTLINFFPELDENAARDWFTKFDQALREETNG